MTSQGRKHWRRSFQLEVRCGQAEGYFGIDVAHCRLDGPFEFRVTTESLSDDKLRAMLSGWKHVIEKAQKEVMPEEHDQKKGSKKDKQCIVS